MIDQVIRELESSGSGRRLLLVTPSNSEDAAARFPRNVTDSVDYWRSADILVETR